MALRVRNYTFIKVVQATHHQGDVRYGTSSGIHCSCMPLISVTWALFRSPGMWDTFDLDCVLGKGGQLFKSIGKFRYLGMEDLPQVFLVKNSSINVEFLENKTGEITAVVYLISISEIVNGVQQIVTALVIVNNDILGLIWRNDSMYLFDSHRKDETDNLSSFGTVILLKFDVFYSLENYVRSVY